MCGVLHYGSIDVQRWGGAGSDVWWWLRDIAIGNYVQDNS